MALNPPAGIGELHGALHKSLADVALVYSQTPLSYPPGSKWQYSNTGIAVLARRLLDSAQYNAVGEGQRRGRTELAERRRRRT